MKRKSLLPVILLLFFFALINGGIIGSAPASAQTTVTVSPANGQTSVSTSAAISMTFSPAIDASTLINGSTFLLTTSTAIPVSGTLSPTSGTVNTVTFTPSSPLSPQTSYTATIAASVIGATADFTWSFTTGSGTVTGLTVLSTVPTNGATNIVPNIQLTATFSEAVTLNSVSNRFTLANASSGPVSGTVALDSTKTVATFTPSSELEVNTTYTATIASGVQAANGDKLAADDTWSFTTGTSDFEHSGAKCFIATAAYGSYLDPHVKILRDFRDKHLLTNAPGRAFVSFYYSYSPPVADFISRHEGLRTATRVLLTPIVYVAEYPFSLGFIFVAGIAILVGRKRKKKK